MKHNWEYKKLGEVCEILDSKRKPVTKKDRKVGQYPYYGAMGIQDYVDSFIFDGDYLLVGEDGAKWGANDKSAFQVHGKCWVNNHAHILKVNEDEICSSFIEHYLVGKDLSSYITGAVVPKLTQASLVSIPIPLPPLPIQQKIVAELDKVCLIIEKKKQQLKELDKLAQAIFYDMFGDPVENEKGWEVKNISDICSLIVRGPFGSALKKEFFVKPDETTYKVYEQKHAINKSVSIGEYYISKEKYNELKRFEVFPRDIIMSCSGTIGELYQIPDDAPKGIMNQALLKFTLNNMVCSRVFMFLMNDIKNNMVIHGCGLQNIGSVKEIKQIKFGLPPLSLQQSFAAKIEAIEKQKELISRSIKEAQTLFDERMDYWFD